MVFESMFKIISNFIKDILNIETVVTNQKLALINIVKKYSSNAWGITCFSHYKEDLIKNLLYRKIF